MQLDLAKHIVEHMILGIKKGSTGAVSRPPEFKVLRTPTISPVASVDYSILSNANGTLLKPFTNTKIQTTGFQITGTDLKPVYNSNNIFTRTKAVVSSYVLGTVSLNVVPNADFIIHYRYFLESDDTVSNYVPDDIVTNIESEFHTAQIAKKVAFDYASKGIISDTEMQGAMDSVLNYLYNGAAKQTYINEAAVEAPDGARSVFTLPYAHEVRGDNIRVFLNGIGYNRANISVVGGGTQFSIINDHVPKAKDDLSVTYDRRL